MPRWGEPEEVGRVVAALLAGELPYTVGQAVRVDGGATLGSSEGGGSASVAARAWRRGVGVVVDRAAERACLGGAGKQLGLQAGGAEQSGRDRLGEVGGMRSSPTLETSTVTDF